MKRINLPHDHALVLQHIRETGEEDFSGLAETMHLGRERLAHIIQALHHKRLIIVEHSTAYAEILVRLSAKGKRLMTSVWPEAQFSVG